MGPAVTQPFGEGHCVRKVIMSEYQYYKFVAKKLKELRDASRLENREFNFQQRLAAFRDRYSRRSAMMRRINKL